MFSDVYFSIPLGVVSYLSINLLHLGIDIGAFLDRFYYTGGLLTPSEGYLGPLASLGVLVLGATQHRVPLLLS